MDPTPERTAFVRFRKVLSARGLDQDLFDDVTSQLKARAVRVKMGTIVDATIIASASKSDDEARWVKHKQKLAVHGFKAHVGADAKTALVEEIAINPANVHDGKAGGEVLPDDSGQVFADSAYSGETFRAAVRAKGERRASWPHTFGDATSSNRSPGSKHGTGRSIAYAVGSKKSSGPGSGHMDCDECDRWDWLRPACRSASPPSITI